MASFGQTVRLGLVPCSHQTHNVSARTNQKISNVNKCLASATQQQANNRRDHSSVAWALRFTVDMYVYIHKYIYICRGIKTGARTSHLFVRPRLPTHVEQELNSPMLLQQSEARSVNSRPKSVRGHIQIDRVPHWVV